MLISLIGFVALLVILVGLARKGLHSQREYFWRWFLGSRLGLCCKLFTVVVATPCHCS